MIMEQVAQSKFQVNWAVLGVKPPKSSLTTECPGLGTTGKSFLLLHYSQGGESRRIPGAHLGHSLQVPAGDDGPAAVPAGKGRVRRA